MIRRSPHFWLVCILPLCAAIGCQSMFPDGEMPFDLRRKIPWKTNDDYEKRPDTLICIWTEAKLETEGQKTQRGFGGRVLMYSGSSQKAKKINGTLVVYAYDLSKGVSPTNTPDRKFVFTKEQLKKVYQKNQLGDSYNIWLPWDDVGGMKTTIKLVARFEPDPESDLKVVVSEPTENVLPGVEPPPKPAAMTAFEFNPQSGVTQQGVIQQTVMHAPSYTGNPIIHSRNSPDAPSIKMQTTTIPVGPRLGQGTVAQSLTPTQPPMQIAWGRPDSAQPMYGQPAQGNPFGAAAPTAWAPNPYLPNGVAQPPATPPTFNAPLQGNGPTPAHYGSLPGSGAAAPNQGAMNTSAQPAADPGAAAGATTTNVGGVNTQMATTWGAARPAAGRPLMQPRQMGGTIRSTSPTQTAQPVRPTMWNNSVQ